MKIEKIGINYCIKIKYYNIPDTAKDLNITPEKLEDILKNYNAEFDISNVYHHFKIREDAEKVAKILESYLVMNKLTK